MKRNEKAVFERSKQIANILNALYTPLNIFIALVGVIVWTEKDEIKMDPDGDATLNNFLQYRRERLAMQHPNDNAQLITAITLDSHVVGKALKGPICTYEYSGGVNMDHHDVVAVVATTVAHELGHNFGMEHDDEGDKCRCPEKKCIMASASSSPPSPSRWSSCSKMYLEAAYEQGMDYCLKNVPEAVFGPVCGNGYLEEGEECDCGPHVFCKNPCCNAATCKLKDGASCGMGACCDTSTCQVKKAAVQCRRAISECDLPEYCDGESEFCPSDVHVQDGTECGEGKAYCYNKQCKSHEDQCQLLWGPTGKTAISQCFDNNVAGDVNGNCGYDRLNKTYKRCMKRDVMCGTLHCTYLNERLEFGMESAAILAKFYVTIGNTTRTCRSAIVDLGLFSTDPGLSPNGAKCGKDKACLNQRCVPLEKLRGAKCPFDCFKNGVCNRRGNCHCFVGYAPPYCDYPGAGGSVDSGPASDPSTGYSFMIAMYVIFLCIVPLTAITAFAIYYFRRHLKTWWMAKARKAAIKSRAQQAVDRKSRPVSKFQIDCQNLKNLEISGPIPQDTVVPEVTTFPRRGTRDRTSLRTLDISDPVLQSSTNHHNNNNNNNSTSARPVPLRPAPQRPDSKTVQRAPSCPGNNSMRVKTNLNRSVSQRSSGRPTSVPSSRPCHPPPRPPPPRSASNNPPATEEVGSAFLYDDCANPANPLNFQNTVLAFVHGNHARRPEDSSVPHRQVALQPSRTGFPQSNTTVSSLAQKFEQKQDSRQKSLRNGSQTQRPLIPSKGIDCL